MLETWMWIVDPQLLEPGRSFEARRRPLAFSSKSPWPGRWWWHSKSCAKSWRCCSTGVMECSHASTTSRRRAPTRNRSRPSSRTKASKAPLNTSSAVSPTRTPNHSRRYNHSATREEIRIKLAYCFYESDSYEKLNEIESLRSKPKAVLDHL